MYWMNTLTIDFQKLSFDFRCGLFVEKEQSFENEDLFHGIAVL